MGIRFQNTRKQKLIQFWFRLFAIISGFRLENIFPSIFSMFCVNKDLVNIENWLIKQ